MTKINDELLLSVDDNELIALVLKTFYSRRQNTKGTSTVRIIEVSVVINCYFVRHQLWKAITVHSCDVISGCYLRQFICVATTITIHDYVIIWKHFPRYWPFVRGIHRSPVNSPHKGQWRGTLMFCLICALNKQWWGWWFETPSRPLWRHCNVVAEMCCTLCFFTCDELPSEFMWGCIF